MKDLYDIGGVPVLMKALLDGGYLHGDCITVTGKTIAENLEGRRVPDRAERDPPDLERRSRRPAAWSCSRATSRRKGRS